MVIPDYPRGTEGQPGAQAQGRGTLYLGFNHVVIDCQGSSLIECVCWRQQGHSIKHQVGLTDDESLMLHAHSMHCFSYRQVESGTTMALAPDVTVHWPSSKHAHDTLSGRGCHLYPWAPGANMFLRVNTCDISQLISLASSCFTQSLRADDAVRSGCRASGNCMATYRHLQLNLLDLYVWLPYQVNQRWISVCGLLRLAGVYLYLPCKSSFFTICMHAGTGLLEDHLDVSHHFSNNTDMFKSITYGTAIQHCLYPECHMQHHQHS